MNIKTIPVGCAQTNCYLATDEATGKCVIIDPGAFDSRLEAAISEIGGENVSYILLTH